MSESSATPPGESPSVEPPPVVPDHEVLPRIIGKGAYGSIFLARNVMGTWRAVKTVYRSRFDSERTYEREWEGIRKFEPVSRTHPSQVSILHIGRNDAAGYFYYVMELADDATAAPPSTDPDSGQAVWSTTIDSETYQPRTLAHELKTQGRLPFEDCLNISLSLATALDHLHKNGLVHRDIKPGNIVFVNGQPKLADIGTVTLAGGQTFVGTEGYIAPEGPGREAADIFSLGKVMYEMMTGLDRTEFPNMPPGFEDWDDHERWVELNKVVLQAAADPLKGRYATAADLHRDLVSVQAGQSPKWHLQQKRVKNLRVALSVTGLVLVGAIAFVFEQGRVNREGRRGTLLREAQVLRLGPREHGWSTNALSLLVEAGRIRVDHDLRAEAMAVLAEVDSRVLEENTNVAARHLAVDPEGRRWLSDGGSQRSPARWEWGSTNVIPLAGTNTGPVWFGSNGSPRHLVDRGAGIVAVMDLEQGAVLREFRFPSGTSLTNGNVIALAVSPDASLCAAAASRDPRGQLAVWEVETGRLVGRVDQACTALAFSPSADCLATGDTQGHVQIWSLPGFNEFASFQQDGTEISALAFRRDLSQPDEALAQLPWLLATGDRGGRTFIYQLVGKRLKAICPGAFARVETLAFSPDGMTLASGGVREVRLLDVATGHLNSMATWDRARGLTFAPDGTKFAVGREGWNALDPSRVGLIEVVNGQGVRAMHGLSSQTGRLVWSHDGQRLAALAQNWEIAIWNAAAGRLERLLQAPMGSSVDNASLAFSPDGWRFASAASEGARLWSLKTGSVLTSWPLPEGQKQLLSFDESGRLTLFQCDRLGAMNAGICRIRDLLPDGSSKVLVELPAFTGRIRNGAMSSDGSLVAVCSGDSKPPGETYDMKIYDTSTGRLVFSPQTSRSDKVLFDATGRLLAYWDGASSRTTVCTLPEGKEVRQIDTILEAFGPGGEHYLTGGFELRKANDPKWSLNLGLGASGRVGEFSPDGRQLAVGISDGTVLVYELEGVVRRLKQLGLGW